MLEIKGNILIKKHTSEGVRVDLIPDPTSSFIGNAINIFIPVLGPFVEGRFAIEMSEAKDYDHKGKMIQPQAPKAGK